MTHLEQARKEFDFITCPAIEKEMKNRGLVDVLPSYEFNGAGIGDSQSKGTGSDC
jgi:hypothetical protein